MLTGGDAVDPGFARADRPRTFVFPDDHGPHPDFQTEWWYFTGHLDATEPTPRSFGFQWTLFRRALAPEAPDRPSAWATRQLYMGHFALTDISGERFYAFERFARGAADLAGATADPFEVWLEDWRAHSTTEGEGEGEGIWPLRLRAAQDGVAIDLRLSPAKPHVLQGDRGLSFKSADSASYYYSFTRLEASGTATVDGRSVAVEGSAWLDREWSTSVLAEDQAGWDWFSIQLDDGRDLMVYQLRQHDGRADASSSGVVVAPDGAATRLTSDQFTLEVTARWRSPRTGGDYPASWRLRVPDHDLDLVVEPELADQELDVAFPYWEGAVRVESDDAAIRGRGYVELVGYIDL